MEPPRTYHFQTISEEQKKETERSRVLNAVFGSNRSTELAALLQDCSIERQKKQGSGIETQQSQVDDKAPCAIQLTFTLAADDDQDLKTRRATGLLRPTPEEVVLRIDLETQKPVHFSQETTVPSLVRDILILIFSSGITTAAIGALYQLLRAWVDARNGRKIRIKIGDTEVDVTQMPATEVVQLCKDLRQWQEQEQVRDALLGGRISLQEKGIRK